RPEILSRSCRGERALRADRSFAPQQPRHLRRNRAGAERLQLHAGAGEEAGRAGGLVRDRAGDRAIECRRRRAAGAAPECRAVVLRVSDRRRAALLRQHGLRADEYNGAVAVEGCEDSAHRSDPLARRIGEVDETVRGYSVSPSLSTPAARRAPSSHWGRRSPPVRISFSRVCSSAAFFSARSSSDAALSRSTTTMPSASPTIRSPGLTATPPQEIGQLMRPGASLVGPFG